MKLEEARRGSSLRNGTMTSPRTNHEFMNRKAQNDGAKN